VDKTLSKPPVYWPYHFPAIPHLCPHIFTQFKQTLTCNHSQLLVFYQIFLCLSFSLSLFLILAVIEPHHWLFCGYIQAAENSSGGESQSQANWLSV
jgi:hypothetical protein